MDNHVKALSILTTTSVEDMMPHVDAILTILEKRFDLRDVPMETDRPTFPTASDSFPIPHWMVVRPAKKPKKKRGRLFLATTPFVDSPPQTVTEEAVSNDVEGFRPSRNSPRDESLPLEPTGGDSKNLCTADLTRVAPPTSKPSYRDMVASDLSNPPWVTKDKIKLAPDEVKITTYHESVASHLSNPSATENEIKFTPNELNITSYHERMPPDLSKDVKDEIKFIPDEMKITSPMGNRESVALITEDKINLTPDEVKTTSPISNGIHQENVASELAGPTTLTTHGEVKINSASQEAVPSNFMNSPTGAASHSAEGFAGEPISNTSQDSNTASCWYVPSGILNSNEHQSENSPSGQWNASSGFLDPFMGSSESSFQDLRNEASYIPTPNNFQWNASPQFTNSNTTLDGLSLYNSPPPNLLPVQRGTYDASAFQQPRAEMPNGMVPPPVMLSRVGQNSAFPRMNPGPSMFNNPFAMAAGPNGRAPTPPHPFQWANSYNMPPPNFTPFPWEPTPSPILGPNFPMPRPDYSFNPHAPSNNTMDPRMSLHTPSFYQNDTNQSFFTNNVSPSSVMPQVPTSFFPR